MEADGSSPSEPASTAASSLRMSPNRFSVRSTSTAAGFGDQTHRRVVHVQVLEPHVGVVRRDPGHRLPPQLDTSSTFALSTDVTDPRRPRAASNATRATRSISATE